MRRERRGHASLYLGLNGHVGRLEQPAGPGRHTRAGVAVHLGHHDAGALGGEAQGDGAADARGGAGDEDGFAFEAIHAGFPGRSVDAAVAVVAVVVWPDGRA